MSLCNVANHKCPDDFVVMPCRFAAFVPETAESRHQRQQRRRRSTIRVDRHATVSAARAWLGVSSDATQPQVMQKRNRASRPTSSWDPCGWLITSVEPAKHRRYSPAERQTGSEPSFLSQPIFGHCLRHCSFRTPHLPSRVTKYEKTGHETTKKGGASDERCPTCGVCWGGKLLARLVPLFCRERSNW
jgi:hypothetical protein